MAWQIYSKMSGFREGCVAMITDIRKYNKIILIGSGGSGKSWLSKRISKLTGYPVFHLDVEHWKPGWVMPEKDERLAHEQKIMQGDKWIIDGNYNNTMEIRFAAADLVIFLDMFAFCQ